MFRVDGFMGYLGGAPSWSRLRLAIDF
jgi:hypothetical protein